MNLALNYCWKEWRAQRGILLAYTLLVHACLCIGLSIAPTHYWREEGFGVHALTWFVTVGVIGVVAFVAPGLVRGEFGGKDDQFVRRLPGALLPSFVGKLLFFVLAAVTLPLLGLLVGEVFVHLQGSDWPALYRWEWSGEVSFAWPQLIVGCGAAMMLAPWVWAIGTWLPGGRMALGGTILFVLVLGIGITAVLRQSPNIERGIAWQGWLCTIMPMGLVVAALSWTKGRRGGGALRSARVGLLSTAVLLLPAAIWFGERAWQYHHPDLQRLERFSVRGLSPDGRYVLAEGAGYDEWAMVPVRIDLVSGEAQQLAGIYSATEPLGLRGSGLSLGGQRRYWKVWSERDDFRVLDLTTGTFAALDYEPNERRSNLPAALRAEVLAEQRATTPFRAPGGRRVWIEADELCFADDQGTIERRPWLLPGTVATFPKGHGAQLFSRRGERQLFDFTNERLVALPRTDMRTLLVSGQLLARAEAWRKGRWHLLADGAEPVECEALRSCQLLGLFDDRRVLACQTVSARHGRAGRLFLFDPAVDVVTEIVLPPDLPFESVQIDAPVGRHESLLCRDPLGRVWLRCRSNRVEVFAVIDDALRATMLWQSPSDLSNTVHLLAWDVLPQVVMLQGREIVRIDLDTDERTVLFPRR